MRSRLLRTTAAAVASFALAGAPLSFAQTVNTDSPAAAAPDAPTAPSTPPPINSAPPAKIAPEMGTTAAPAPAADSAATSNMQPSGTVLAGNLKGTTVKSTAGEDLATLSDLIVAPEGSVSGAVLTVGGVLGVGGKEVMVPWEKLTVGPASEITLAMSSQQIDALPAFQPLPREASTGMADPAKPSQ